jgi:hypothetical protein
VSSYSTLFAYKYLSLSIIPLYTCCCATTLSSWFGTTDAATSSTEAAVPPVLCLHGAFGSGKSLTLCAVCVLIDSLAQAHTAATTTADAIDDTTAISNSSSSSSGSSSGYNRYGYNSSSGSSDTHQQAAAAAAAAAATVVVSSSNNNKHSVYTGNARSSEVKAVGQWSSGGPRVLLASATNVAVDGVLLRLIREGFESIARLGSLRRIANVSYSVLVAALLHQYIGLG